jgi:hypothetical protein
MHIIATNFFGALLRVLKTVWTEINKSSALIALFSVLFSALSVLFTGATFWETFYPHKELLLTIGTPRPTSTGPLSSAGKTFDLAAVITNAGNRTEIIPCISIAINPSAPPNNQFLGKLAGPYALKSGDAVTVPLQFGFDLIQLVGSGSDKDVYVDVVTISPDNHLIAVDIPVSRITFSRTQEGSATYTEKRSAGYNDGLIDIFSVSKSKFAPNCREGIRAFFDIRVIKARRLPKQPYPPSESRAAAKDRMSLRSLPVRHCDFP